MKTQRLNLNKIEDIRMLAEDIPWLLSPKKGDKIIIEADPSLNHFAILKANFIILTDRLNKLLNEEPIKINYDEIDINDFEDFATKLTKATGVNFSVEIVNDTTKTSDH